MRADDRRNLKGDSYVRTGRPFPLSPRRISNQYRKLARYLQRPCTSAGAGAVLAWATRLVETLLRLQDVDGRPIPPSARFDREASSSSAAGYVRERDRSPGRCLLVDAQFFFRARKTISRKGDT